MTPRSNARLAAAALTVTTLIAPPGTAWAQCSASGTNQTCTNSGVLPNTATPALSDNGTLTVTNTASGIIGTSFSHSGINATNAAIVTNYGAITGLAGVSANFANIVNFGTITGQSFGVIGNQVLVTNSGAISGLMDGIGAQNTVTLVNSGTVTAQTFAVYSNAGTVNVTNSGTITQTQGTGGFPGNAAIFGNTGATVSNTGTISGIGFGIETYDGAATVTNSGTISGGEAGILSYAGNTVVTNSGTIAGGQFGIIAGNNASVVNSGTIIGGNYGIAAQRNLTLINSGTVSGTYGLAGRTDSVTNSGTISGGMIGIGAQQGGSIVNTGTISGGFAAILSTGGAVSVTNAGVISSPGGTAIALNGGNDILTLLPGSKIIGAIDLGTNDTIHVNAGNQNLTFSSLAGTTIDGTAPYVVVGNRIVSLDPTQFSGSDRNLLAVIGAVAGSLGSANAAPAADGGTLGFAGPGYVAASAEEAFADLFSYAKTPNDAVAFKNPSVAFGTGSTIWARGFLGQRVQEADGPVLRNVTNFYGGMIGVDSWFAPDLKLGVLAGGGHIGTSIDLNSGSSASDLGFGGLYGHKEFGRAFVDFDVLAGASANSSSRTVNNNLLAGGLETATANFGGWFVSPEAVAGYRFDVVPQWTLTPAARLRYLAAGFAGYTETGSTANLTVGGRLAQALEERGELTLTNTQSSDLGRFQVSATIGVIGQERVGGSTINAQILGQALAFATPGKASIAGGFVAGQFDWKTLWGATLFAGGEFSEYSDSSSIVTGRAGVKVGF
ncbi:MAG: autotransporter domain-containing protein [Xanthobacteraceae bacterium]|nr:autotransporter domain-containing protein [Xanthobacteraceae bacterium]